MYGDTTSIATSTTAAAAATLAASLRRLLRSATRAVTRTASSGAPRTGRVASVIPWRSRSSIQRTVRHLLTQQRPQAFQRLGRLALDRANGAAEHLRGLGLSQVIPEPEHHHSPLTGRQRPQPVHDDVP